MVQEFFKTYPDIDINSNDENGYTLLLRAVSRGDGRFINRLVELNRLAKYGKVDWNAVAPNGNNAWMIELDRTKYDTIAYAFAGWVKPDYINPITKKTVLQEAIIRNDEEFIRSFTSCVRKDNRTWFNIDITHPDTPPTAILALQQGIKGYTLESIFDYKPDFDAVYNGLSIYDYRENIDSGKILNELKSHLVNKKFAELKAYYEKEGNLSLQQISDLMNFPRFDLIFDKPLNNIGEHIGHFIAEIYPKDFEETKKISELIDRLAMHYIYNISRLLTHGDVTGKTPLEKAFEARNTIVLKLFIHKLSGRGRYAKLDEVDLAGKIKRLVEASDIDNKDELLKLLWSKY